MRDKRSASMSFRSGIISFAAVHDCYTIAYNHTQAWFERRKKHVDEGVVGGPRGDLYFKSRGTAR